MPTKRGTGGRASKARIGVIDIGSNSVRLVVYDGTRRFAVPLFNERVICGLGRDLAKTGRLDPEGREAALQSLGRFATLAGAMGVTSLEALATAAVRDAEDGPVFVDELKRRFGLAVRVLSGREEAQLSARGVLGGIPDADGVMCDLGGGSLELVVIGPDGFGEGITLPVGTLRLMQAAGRSLKKARKIVDHHLDGLAWLGAARGRDLYLVGGAWRTLARVHMAQAEYPLSVVHSYTLSADQGRDLASLIGRLSARSVQSIPSVSKRRVATLPYAALVLGALIEAAAPRKLVFSAYGLREGWFIERLPKSLSNEDPLLAGCREMGERLGRHDSLPQALLDWPAPLFPDETPAERRLRLAATMLSDIGWSEHPDYRASQAYFRVLRLGMVGIDHRERAFLALTSYVRYGGAADDKTTVTARRLLPEEDLRRATVLGLALRLVQTLSGGAPELVGRSRIVVDGDDLLLIAPAGDGLLGSEAVQRRLRSLAAALGRNPRIDAEIDPSVAKAS